LNRVAEHLVGSHGFLEGKVGCAARLWAVDGAGVWVVLAK